MNWNKYLRPEEIATLDDGEAWKLRKIEIDLFLKFLKLIKYKTGKKLLDVGASKKIDEYLTECKFDVTKLSLIKDNADIVCDMHEMTLKDNLFDIVYCGHTIEHALSPYIVLCEINRVLKQDGILMLIFPEEGNYWDYAPHHYSCLTVNQASNLLLKTGFEILKTTRFRLRITEQEMIYDIGIVAKKIGGWKHDLKGFKTHLIPFEASELFETPLFSTQEIFYIRNDDIFKNIFIRQKK